MAKLIIGSITAIVNGYTLNNGLPYFQKSVPAALRSRVGKATIKVRLRAEDGNLAIQCHRLHQQYTALFQAMKADHSIAPSEVRLAAHALLAQAGAEPGQGRMRYPAPSGLPADQWDPDGHVAAVAEFFEDRFTEPNAVTRAALQAFQGKLPVLLSEAFSVYLDNHPRGQELEFQEAQRQHWNKLILLVGDKAIESVKREEARRYRDQRLASGMTPSTVAREINVIRAVFNKAIREIPLSISNPFEAITIPNGSRNAKDRIPYTQEEVQALVNGARAQDDEKRRIVLALAVTGARLSEIVGLRRCDVDLAAKMIRLREYPGRRLKTPQSARDVPVLRVGMEALARQLAESESEFVFPGYMRGGKIQNGSASATLNKWAKKLVAGKSMHCFRHAFRDQLRRIGCPEAVSDEIGGWSDSDRVSVQYGLGYPMDLKRRHMNKAYAWLK